MVEPVAEAAEHDDDMLDRRGEPLGQVTGGETRRHLVQRGFDPLTDLGAGHRLGPLRRFFGLQPPGEVEQPGVGSPQIGRAGTTAILGPLDERPQPG